MSSWYHEKNYFRKKALTQRNEVIKKLFFWFEIKKIFYTVEGEASVVLFLIKIVTTKMLSSESEESDSDIGENVDNFLYAKNHKYEWKDLEFDGLDKHLAYIFHDS